MRILPQKLSFFLACIITLFSAVPIFSQNTQMEREGKDNIATFAGGCFWCTQKDFDQVKGVVSTTAGFTGGSKINPTYEEVSAGKTGHVEAVQITYDPSVVSYEKLLDVYFHSVDPTDDKGQFCDRGEQYRPVIFYHSPEQERLAQAYKDRLIRSKEVPSVKVAILPAGPFYPAKKYHQKYYQKRPLRYRFYRHTCGRDKRLKELWH